MATQQLLFDIFASSKGVDKTFDGVVSSANNMATKLGGEGSKAAKSMFSPLMAAAGGGTIAAALTKGLSSALDVDAMTRKMTAGLALTGPESEKAGAAAGKLYSGAYGESFGDVTAAVSATMSSISGLRGGSEADIQAMTGKVMDLSSAFELDVGRTAQVAGQMITTGLAKDGVEAADLLAASLSKVPVNVREDVLDAVDEYGPMFAQLGISGGAAMTMLVDASAKGAVGIDKTGDALKEFTIRSTDMSKASGDAYKDLGLNQTDMTNKILAGGDTARGAFDQIIMGLGDMKDPGAQAAAAIALFGSPLEDLGTGEIPKFIDGLLNSQEALGTVEGSAAKLGETIGTGPGAALTTFQRTAEASLGSLGTQILPVLTPILTGLQQFAPIIGPAVIALGALAAVIAIVNFVMATNPVVWIVVGIVALIAAVVALVMNWETVVGFLTQIWSGFVGWFQGVMSGFVGWWNGVWSGFMGWTQDLWNGFAGFIGGIWSAIVAIATAGFNAFIAPILAGLAGLWTFISGIFTNIGNFIAGVWNWITSLVGAILAAFVQEHGAQILAIWNNIVAVFTAIGAFFVGIWNWYIGIITTALAAVWGVISAVFNAVWGFIAGVFSAIGGFIAGIWGTIVGIISGAVSAVWGVIVSGFGAAWGFIASVFGQVSGFLGGVWNNIIGGVSGMIGNVLGVLGGLGGQIMAALSGAGSWLYSAGVNIVQGLLSGVRSLAGTIGNFFLGLMPGWIVGPFKAALGINSPSRVFAGFGENLGQGVIIGVDRMQSSLDRKMAKLVTVPDLPDITPGAVGAPARPAAGTGTTGTGTTGPGTAGTESGGGLTDADRQLMRDFIKAADRPFVATWNGREVLTAVRESERKGTRR